MYCIRQIRCQALTPFLAGGLILLSPVIGLAQKKKTLQETDFTYIGMFKLPRSVSGFPTNHSTAGITFRYVDGELRIFSAVSNRQDEGYSAVYEVRCPALSTLSFDVSTAPVARVTNFFGDIYGDLRDGDHIETYGLLWDESSGCLIWSIAEYYAVTGENLPTLGATELCTGAVYGLWNTTAHMQRVRGGATLLPEWFAKEHTGGNQLALGHGGIYNGSITCSRGPCLYAVPTPQDGVETLPAQVLVNYPNDPCQHFCLRDADYYYDDNSWSNKDPDGDIGYWTWDDWITGAGTVIDTPTKQGFLTLPNLAHGYIRYVHEENFTGVRSDYQQTFWFMHSLDDLGAVADGTINEWDPIPTYWAAGSELSDAGVNGCCYDPQSECLYVLDIYADGDGADYFPAIFVYQVGQCKP